jgi:hypothetical protein
MKNWNEVLKGMVIVFFVCITFLLTCWAFKELALHY